MELDPVPVFAALAHPQRLAVMRLLMRHHPQPVPAGGIAGRLDLRASTLSGYLAQMMEAGLIAQTRHGTSLHYGVCLEVLGALNTAWIGGVCGWRAMPGDADGIARVRTVLILGHGNAGPSLAVEAILRRDAGDAYEVLSAGVAPRDAPDPDLIAALRSCGCETEALFTKPVSLVSGPDAPAPDVVIVLGSAALAQEPDWPGAPVRTRWSLPGGLSAQALVDHLEGRLAGFAALDPALSPAPGLLRALDAPG